jgi:hypothetical protein
MISNLPEEHDRYADIVIGWPVHSVDKTTGFGQSTRREALLGKVCNRRVEADERSLGITDLRRPIAPWHQLRLVHDLCSVPPADRKYKGKVF